MVKWDPYTAHDVYIVWGLVKPPPDMLRDLRLWFTRCNLLFIWMVEPYNPERVMRQFGLHQDIPPPSPRRLVADVHTQDNKGMSCFDRSHRNQTWITKWIDEAESDGVRKNRRYNGEILPTYNEWYRASTWTLLTGPPPSSPTHLTWASAYHRDTSIDEFRKIAQDAQNTLNLRNMDSTEEKSMVKRIFNTAIKGLRRLGCSSHDDVVSRAFDMPEAPSNRPSMVRVSQPFATPTVPVPSTSHTSNPRRDSSLLDRSKSAHISQRHGATQEDDHFPSYPSGQRFSYTEGEYSQRFNTQESVDPTWSNMGAGLGHNMPPLRGRDHMQSQYPTQESLVPTWPDMTQQPQYYGSTSQQPRDDVTGIVEEFFGDETRTEDEENQYGRGLRPPHPPRPRLSPSGPRPRQHHRHRREE
ncbi:uncharacterized protein [Lolium perenne]|uniref:uncharacterized protein isoform X2 n=1 Tax=Lolium perenne TaxID=4522 RepID=UPI003A9A2427